LGGPNSGRRSLKLIAIEALMEVQTLLLKFRYEDLDGTMTRDELKARVDEYIGKTRVAQEEIERSNLK